MDINKLIPDEEVELTEILTEKEAAFPHLDTVPEYRYSKVEDKLAMITKQDFTASASAMKAELFKQAVSGSSGGGSLSTVTVTFKNKRSTEVKFPMAMLVSQGGEQVLTIGEVTIPGGNNLDQQVIVYNDMSMLLLYDNNVSTSGGVTYQDGVAKIEGDGLIQFNSETPVV